MIWLHAKHIKVLDQVMPYITDADNWVIPIFLLIVILGFKGGKIGKIALSLLIISLYLVASALCGFDHRPLKAWEVITRLGLALLLLSGSLFIYLPALLLAILVVIIHITFAKRTTTAEP